MRQNIIDVSRLLRGRAIFTSMDYLEVFESAHSGDILYMDPPYQGVCGNRDQRYSNGIDFNQFVLGLEELNRKSIQYLVSYDGRLG
mgnify:CR=1 FL=1